MFDRKTVVKDFCISRIAVLCIAQKVNTAEDVLFLNLYQHVQAQSFKSIPVLPRVLLSPYCQQICMRAHSIWMEDNHRLFDNH